MNLNEKTFVETIKDHQLGYAKKLGNALRLNVVTQMSRAMLIDLAGIYTLVNPQYNVKMLNISCASCVMTFMKDVANKYFSLLNEYEATEVKSFSQEVITSNEPVVTSNSITGEELTPDQLESDLNKLSNEELSEIVEEPVIKRKPGRPFKNQ